MNVTTPSEAKPLAAQRPHGWMDEAPRRLGMFAYLNCFNGIVWREVLRFLHQRERFFSALVRPLVWLLIFAAGFRTVLGVAIIPPYETYVLYEEFVTPGLIGMILLFNAMQSSLSMVYDRETGTMRTLLVSPFPRWFLLVAKIIGGVAVALLQVYTFVIIASYWDVEAGGAKIIPSFMAELPMPWFAAIEPEFIAGLPIPPDPSIWTMDYKLIWVPWELKTPAFALGHITVLPALILAGLMLGSLALFMSSIIKQLENFAGVMNFVIFPMFFASSALYPLWRIRESSWLLYQISTLNPFTHAVELVRFAFYCKLEGPAITSLWIVIGCTVVFLGAAVYAYDPSKGLIGRRGGPGGGA